MPSPTKGPRLGGGPAHERMILANLATALFEHDSITTTEAKAKRIRPLAERLITFAKRGDLHARRRVMTVVRDKSVVHRLFAEIAPDMADRPGGYTRITKIGPRKGDNAPMAVIELVREPIATKTAVKEAEGVTKRATKEADAQAGDAQAGDDAATADSESAGTTSADDADTTSADDVDTASADDDDAAASADAKADGSESATEEPALDNAASDAPATEAAGVAVAASLPKGAVAATEDGSAPDGYPVKGNADSGKYHVPGSRWFNETIAEFWFASAEDAKAAGFEPAGGEAAQNGSDDDA